MSHTPVLIVGMPWSPCYGLLRLAHEIVNHVIFDLSLFDVHQVKEIQMRREGLAKEVETQARKFFYLMLFSGYLCSYAEGCVVD